MRALFKLPRRKYYYYYYLSTRYLRYVSTGKGRVFSFMRAVMTRSNRLFFSSTYRLLMFFFFNGRSKTPRHLKNMRVQQRGSVFGFAIDISRATDGFENSLDQPRYKLGNFTTTTLPHRHAHDFSNHQVASKSILFPCGLAKI